jgi:single-strand DNA-binding protein
MDLVIAKGNLVRDIEMRRTGSGKSVGGFTLAVNKSYGDKKKAVFLKCTAWEKTAELIQKYLRRGDPLIVEGEHDNSEWTDKNGIKRYETFINVKRIEFCGHRNRKEGGERKYEPTPHEAKKVDGYQPDYRDNELIYVPEPQYDDTMPF